MSTKSSKKQSRPVGVESSDPTAPRKSRKANEAPRELAPKNSQSRKAKAPNLFEGKKSVQNEDDLVKRGNGVTSRDAVRAKAVESIGRRP